MASSRNNKIDLISISVETVPNTSYCKKSDFKRCKRKCDHVTLVDVMKSFFFKVLFGRQVWLLIEDEEFLKYTIHRLRCGHSN